MRPSVLLVVLFLAGLAGAEELRHEVGGHGKLRTVGQWFPDDSLYRDVAGSSALDMAGELRLKLNSRKGRWTFDAAWQLVGISADTLPLTGLPSDDRRLFDLTDVINESHNEALLHRLDRLWLGYASETTVLRFGRQALSWGNGLFYAPMDLVNPFDPAAIDTEYKVGDDMAYLQYLRADGDDVQAAWVLRRDPLTGDVEADEATIAIKYHGFAGQGEYDVLVAQSYGDPVVGIGAGRGIGGAVWSADLVVTDTDLDTVAQFVTNFAYSWVWGGRNMSGALEYYYNGFGQRRYDPPSLAANPDLVERIARGELFGLGRHYVAGSVMIEISPLWGLTPLLLWNVEDPSALVQLVSNFSLGDNVTLLASLGVPVGSSGSEFGGIETPVPGRYLSSDGSVFLQLAGYF
jgi:hypothetical protein